MTVATIITTNAKRWVAMRFRSDKINELDSACRKLIRNKDQYVAVSDEIFRLTENRIPWAVIAVIDEREGGGNANTFLGNGQSLNHVTTIRPAGQGPFLAHDTDTPLHGPFFRGALVALMDCEPRLGKTWHDWSPGGTLTGLTAYNGYGYDQMGIPSPYIWASTDQYSHGKYIADGVFSASEVDTQLGCAAMLRYMSGLDQTIPYGAPGSVPPVPVTPPPTKVPPMTTPTFTMPDLAKIEATVEGFAFLVPFITPFFPQAPLILIVLEGILKAGAAIQAGGDVAPVLADALHTVANAIHPAASQVIQPTVNVGKDQNATG